ncbi:substrate-binding domain-containing protein [Streptomyces sp. NBC_00377]
MRWRWPPPNWAGYRSAASSGTPTRGSRSWNFNDDIALAVLVAPRSLGLRAPDDLAVIGVDDIPGAATAQPPLTTVVRDIDVIAASSTRWTERKRPMSASRSRSRSVSGARPDRPGPLDRPAAGAVRGDGAAGSRPDQGGGAVTVVRIR